MKNMTVTNWSCNRLEVLKWSPDGCKQGKEQWARKTRDGEHALITYCSVPSFEWNQNGHC